jgi:O-antigen/teichoic acid export membrane protein
MNTPRPGFWKNVVTVSLGTIGAQALPLLIAPLLTRLCTPEDMGAFSVWLGIITVAGVGATLRIENAMVLDHERQQQQICFSVIAYSSTVLALVMTLAAVAGRLFDVGLARHMSWLGLWTLGVGIWLTSYTRATVAYAASHNLFASAAKAKVWGAGTIAVSQLALLGLGMDGSALLAGQLIGLLAGQVAAWTMLRPPLDASRVLADLRASLGTTGQDIAPYGNGDAAARIVQRLAADLA